MPFLHSKGIEEIGKAWLVIGNREYVFKASSKLTYFPTVVKLNTIRTIKI